MLQTAGMKTIPYKTAFVINPTAGDGKAGRIWSKIEDLLNQAGQPYRAYFTRQAGEGTGLAARASSEGAELVVAVGGDGTLKEVAGGINLEQNLFGAIPAGTGNGFVRSCAIPLQWKKAFRGLARWQPRRIDVGRVNDQLFLNVVGTGLDAAVVKTAATKYRALKGYPAYAFAVVDQAATFSRFQCRVECNGLKFEDDQALVALVANGRYYGGKLCIAPQALPDDGQFDFCLLKKRSISGLLSLGARVAAQKHLSSRDVITMRGHTFILETDPPMLCHADGDLYEAPSVKVEIIPSALRILAPRPVQ